jgi:hypothetical protein
VGSGLDLFKTGETRKKHSFVRWGVGGVVPSSIREASMSVEIEGVVPVSILLADRR